VETCAHQPHGGQRVYRRGRSSLLYTAGEPYSREAQDRNRRTFAREMHIRHSGVLLRRHGHALGAPAHRSHARGIVHGLLGRGAICLRVIHHVLGQLLALLALLALLLLMRLEGVDEGRGTVCWRRTKAIGRPVHDVPGRTRAGTAADTRQDSGDPCAGPGVDQTEIGTYEVSPAACMAGWGGKSHK
jgi:hypothetical protein